MIEELEEKLSRFQHAIETKLKLRNDEIPQSDTEARSAASIEMQMLGVYHSRSLGPLVMECFESLRRWKAIQPERTAKYITMFDALRDQHRLLESE